MPDSALSSGSVLPYPISGTQIKPVLLREQEGLDSLTGSSWGGFLVFSLCMLAKLFNQNWISAVPILGRSLTQMCSSS